mmetsp:Transcript_61105/g.132441  ORF Transcript_61105/g.132441 Transcript_61105/m.132441 type:complete len:169 (+) Transcript_61105:92-598(+)
MWRPDPGVCVPAIAEFGEHPKDLEHIKMIKSMPRKILRRREIIVKDTDLKKIEGKQGKVPFHVVCWHLSQYSRSSGPGDEAASFIHVLYESKHERKVLNAFALSGVDLESAEMSAVDPYSSVQHEQDIMYSPVCMFVRDVNVYEESPPLPPEEIRKKLGLPPLPARDG